MEERGLSDILAEAADEVLALNETADLDSLRQLHTALSLHLRSLARLFCPEHGVDPREVQWLLNPSKGRYRRIYLGTLLLMVGHTESSFAEKIPFDPRNYDKLFCDKPGKLGEEWRRKAIEYLRTALREHYLPGDLTGLLQAIFYP